MLYKADHGGIAQRRKGGPEQDAESARKAWRGFVGEAQRESTRKGMEMETRNSDNDIGQENENERWSPLWGAAKRRHDDKRRGLSDVVSGSQGSPT